MYLQNHNFSGNINARDNNEHSDDSDRDATEKEAIAMIETQQLEILGFLRWMHAVVREHGELRARLNPWNSESSCASMTLTNP